VGHDDEPLTLLGRRLPPWARVDVVVIEPGERRVFDAEEWRDALVVVEVGDVALEGGSGRRCRFETGSVLWLDDLPLAALCNEGDVTAVLVAVSRRPSDDGQRVSDA
jgi:hypothetical protein